MPIFAVFQVLNLLKFSRAIMLYSFVGNKLAKVVLHANLLN